MFNYFQEDCTVYREQGNIRQYVCECRNLYYAKIIPLFLNLTQNDLANLLAILGIDHPEERNLLTKLHEIYANTSQTSQNS